VQTADCVPILLAGPRVIGAAHAGWRGSARNVATTAVAALERLGAEPAALAAWIGPSIGPCCYEVGGDVAAQFAGDFVRAGCGGGFRLDLRAVNVSQLTAAALLRLSAITESRTACEVAAGKKRGAGAGRTNAAMTPRCSDRTRLRNQNEIKTQNKSKSKI
jgi:copper oxidase (laccase) domain-containing protein